ncbi:MAG: hypothetical protein FDZ70_08205 [Actinobacteria bacterium]|nr:MAG: hypothetical protein FDZ70_08205 [Actinomycetota bacterium]
MRRVTVIGHRPVMGNVVDVLQRVGVMQVDAHPFDLPSEELPACDERLHHLDEMAADAGFVRDFLARYHESEQPFSAFISEKVHLDADEFGALVPDARFVRLYRQCVALSDRIAHGERERARLLALAADLAPWSGLRLEVGRWRGTEHAALFTGTVPASQGPAIRHMLREVTPLVSVEEVCAEGPLQAWVVLAHRSVVDEVRAALAGSGFAEVSHPDLRDYPAEEIAQALSRAERLTAEIEEAHEAARELAALNHASIVALAESLDSQRDAITVCGRFAATERAFAASGWVRASREAELAGALAPWSDSVDIELADPAEGDAVPVELDNPRWLQPFETLTDLYGRPAYGEIDPTPLLAPFFLLFFSICVADVGYGAMLIGGSQWIKRRLDVAPGVKRFMDLLTYGGAGAMVVGVLLGSWFALDYSVLPPVLQRLRVLDPMGQLSEFLVVCIALGVTQVFFGVIVAGWDAWRRGDRADAVFGQFSTLFLFGMIALAVGVPDTARWALPVGLVGTMLMQGGALSAALGRPGWPVWDRVAGWAWLVATFGAIAVMAGGRVGAGFALLAGASIASLWSRTGRAGVVALLGGAYSVYGMSAFIGDILSYTRLAALSLSGALVGLVFNLMAGMVMAPAVAAFSSGGLGWLWGSLIAVGAAAIFVFGHVFNVVINLIGAFVHPARLQFVEFFSKFYEGSGRPFAPFALRTKSVVLHAGTAGREGGVG